MTSLSGFALAECVRCDVLLAARADGTLTTTGAELLDAHLASCAGCRLVAETLSPRADRGGDLATLPAVNPDGYALGLEVARGGMGRILAARDLRVGRPVAVKELLGRSPRLAARFEREARLTARLQHPGIVPIYEIGTWPDGTPFYSMRLVEGRTLLRAIADAPTVAGRLALLPALIAACEAVAFAHGQRVIHRDLTPSNVLVGAYGETVVIDWGLAKDLAETDPESSEPDCATTGSDPISAQLTNVGAVVGTAGYMAPEQERGESVDERADVYALGAVLHHVLAGTAPRPGRTIDQAAPRAPRDLRSIVAKAMAADANARYPSARELAAELVRFQAGRLVEAHAYSRAELVRRFVRRHRGAVAATLTALLLLGIIGAISVTRIVRSRAEARATLRFVLEEQGRNELLAGNTLRATAYLDAAYQRGSRSPTLQFLLGTALRELSAEERSLDCGGNVRSLEFSPDGSVVAAGCRSIAKIWRLTDGALLATLAMPSHGDGFDGVRFSHDGRRLATWGTDGVVRLWDARTGRLHRELTHGAEITMVTFTPDDMRVASTGFDGAARIWSTDDGALVRAIQVNKSLLLAHVYGVLSPNGRHLLTVTFGGQGAGFDIDTGAHLGGFVHDGTILGGELSIDGRFAATCGSDRRANVWDATTGALKHSFAGHTDVVWKCVFDTAGTRLLTTSHDGTARVWDLATGTLLTAVTHGDIVWTGHFSPDGRRFLTLGVDEFVRVWDARTGNLMSTHETLGGADARFTPDGTRLVALRGDGRLRIWKITTGTLRSAFTPSGGSIEATSGNGTRALVATGDSLALWDTTSAHALPHVAIHAPFSLGNTRLAAMTAGGIAVLDAMTGATVGMLPVTGDLDDVRRVTLSRDGLTVLVVGEDRAPELWRVGDAGPVHVLSGASDAALDPSGARAVAWAPGSRVVAWDVRTGRPGAVLAIPDDFEIVGFAGPERLVVLTNPGVAEQGAALCDTDTGRVLRVDADATAATIDPSGRFVTTVGADRVVRIWSTVDGAVRATFVSDRLQRAQVDPSGELVAAVGEYGTAALVLGVRDGRVLARWALDHDAPLVTQLDFVPPPAAVTWSDDGASIVAQSQSIAIYSAKNPLTPEELAKVKRYVPWRIVNGRVEPIRSRLRARITRNGQPVAGLAVSAVIRRPPNLAGTQYSWSLAKSDVRTLGAITDADGAFELRDLPAGEYTLAVPGSAPIDVLVSVEDRELAITVP